jgi:hypothetical protein
VSRPLVAYLPVSDIDDPSVIVSPSTIASAEPVRPIETATAAEESIVFNGWKFILFSEFLNKSGSCSYRYNLD